MGRSQISENQAIDQDFASEEEMATTSGVLRAYTTAVSGTLQAQHDTHLISDDHLIYVPRDGTRGFTSTVSGVDPIEDYELATKFYIDSVATAISGAFAPYHEYSAIEGQASTTSTDWINRMTLTASGIPEGEYRIAWYWEWRITKTGKTHQTRVVLDDDLVNLLGEVDADMVRTTNWISAAGFYWVTLSGGVHHVDMDWKIDSSLGGTTGYIRRTRLEFWRTG
ncbi:MAG: hypothetical protein KAS36_10190 [Anaerolineales bacterium]|nr:hypothetical protein [Anaerolineales bacterium]